METCHAILTVIVVLMPLYFTRDYAQEHQKPIQLPKPQNVCNFFYGEKHQFWTSRDDLERPFYIEQMPRCIDTSEMDH